MKYKELDIWQDAIFLIKKIYEVIDILPQSEEYNLKSQMKRAVISVALNIAEGKSRASAKEFAHFLNISIASLNEVEACLSICEELQFIEEDTELHEKCRVISYRISALKSKILKGKEQNE